MPASTSIATPSYPSAAVSFTSSCPSISSTILLGSTSSLAHFSSHEPTIYDALEEVEGGLSSEFPALSLEDETAMGEVQRVPLLQIPETRLRGRPSTNSISTIESNVSGVGSWDHPSGILNSPVTDIEDEQGLQEFNVTPNLTTRQTFESNSVVNSSIFL